MMQRTDLVVMHKLIQNHFKQEFLVIRILHGGIVTAQDFRQVFHGMESGLLLMAAAQGLLAKSMFQLTN
jgi:hypothetical protein